MTPGSSHDENPDGEVWSVQSGTPPETPSSVTIQSFDRFDRTQRRQPVNPRGLRSYFWRRVQVLGGAVLMAGVATNEMRHVLEPGGLTLLEMVVIALFALNFAWIAVAVTTSIAGMWHLLWRRRRGTGNRQPLVGRTALLMPIHNEEPERVFAALDAMARSVIELGEGKAFDIFVISDTTDADIALAELEAVRALRRELGNAMAVHYRRRLRNTAHKTGNIREFCERWGRAYDHLLMLDADSLMEGTTIVELTRRMEEDPDAGIIQTVVRLHNGTTLVARLQQFAGAVYGPLLGAGLAWWVQKEGNFWGHNAILRTRALMDSAGLPDLPGKPPLGGLILSHDFVEAALIRRGGWSVIIADDLVGTYEETPATLIDMAVRDRRWCQGNLQHARVIGAKGLHWVNRLHLLNGILSYLFSPIWLVFILAALGLGVQNLVMQHEYFTSEPSLFPLWPLMDPERAVRLFWVTLAVLLGPKFLGLVVFALGRGWKLGIGWVLLPFSLLFEVLLSALMAPIMMLVHCGAVWEVLRGRDSGWRPQRRDDSRQRMSDVVWRHRWHVVLGVVLGATGAAISPGLVAWLSPAVVPIVLSMPVSMFTGSAPVGRLFRDLGLLLTPDEVKPSRIRLRFDEALPVYRDAVARTPDLLDIASNPMLLGRHLALTDRVPPRPPGQIDAVEVVAAAKIGDAHSIQEALSFLSPQERARVQAHPDLMRLLSRVGQSPEARPGSMYEPAGFEAIQGHHQDSSVRS